MQLLIRIADKHPVVSVEYERTSHRGDVIVAVPDSHKWSDAERNHPDWIIVSADITEIEAEALLESGRPGEPQYRRRIGVKVDGLSSGDSLTRAEIQARMF